MGNMREVITQKSSVRTLLDFEDAPIFRGTTTYPLITVLQKSSRDQFNYEHLYQATRTDVQQVLESNQASENQIDTDEIKASEARIFPSGRERKAIESIKSAAQVRFGDVIEISKSVSTNLGEAFLFEQDKEGIPIESDLLYPAVDGKDIRKYSDPMVGKYLLFPYRHRSEELSLVDISEYALAEEHLRGFEENLRNRRYYNKTLDEAGLEWYEYPHVKENHNQPKIPFQIFLQNRDAHSTTTGKLYR